MFHLIKRFKYTFVSLKNLFFFAFFLNEIELSLPILGFPPFTFPNIFFRNIFIYETLRLQEKN